jgi:hypothetical protein
MMGSDAGRAKLRDNKRSVRNDLVKSICPNAADDLVGGCPKTTRTVF